MRKFCSVLLTAGILIVPACLFGAYTGPGAVGEPTDVAAINKNPKDDMYVVLKGKLIRKKKHETYIFSDDTGEIVVDIDNTLLPETDISENTIVEIRGEVDSGVMETPEIDVKELRIIKP